MRVDPSAGLGLLELHLWEKGVGLFGSRGIAGKVCWQPHGASQLREKPRVSQCLTAVLVGNPFQAGIWLGSMERLALNRVKIWAGWRSDGEPGPSESAAGSGISSGMHWVVLLENKALTHLVPA